MEKENEILEQLKQISSKLDVLNDKKEDKNFQLDMLKVQVKQNNIVLLFSVAVSIIVAFFVSYLTLSLTTDIPQPILNLLLWTIFLMELVTVGVFSLIWLVLDHLQMKQINRLRPKQKQKKQKKENL